MGLLFTTVRFRYGPMPFSRTVSKQGSTAGPHDTATIITSVYASAGAKLSTRHLSAADSHPITMCFLHVFPRQWIQACMGCCDSNTLTARLAIHHICRLSVTTHNTNFMLGDQAAGNRRRVTPTLNLFVPNFSYMVVNRVLPPKASGLQG